MTSRPFRFALLVSAAWLTAAVPARAVFLSGDEALQSCVQALQGDKDALSRILKEARALHDRRNRGQELAPEEAEVLREIEETLEAIDPGLLPADRVKVKRPEKFTVPPPEPMPETLSSPAPSSGAPQPGDLFPFAAGEVRTYSGSRRAKLKSGWEPSGRTLRLTTLEVRTEKAARRAAVLYEWLDPPSGRLARQDLFGFRISDKGADVKSRTVFSQPAENTFAALGPPKNARLVRFPIKPGAGTGDFRVLAAETGIEAASRSWSPCVSLGGLQGVAAFCSGVGMVSWEDYDELWELKSREAGTKPAGAADIAGADLKALRRAAKDKCRTDGLEFERLLAAWTIPAAAAPAPLSTDDFLLPFLSARNRKASAPAVPPASAVTRTLAFATEPRGQKRYRVLLQRWTRTGAKDWVPAP